MKELRQKRKVTAEKAVAMLKEKGVEMDEKNAEKVLDLLYFFAKLTVNQCIKGDNLIEKDNYEKGRSIRQSEH